MSDAFLLTVFSLMTFRITWLITRDSFPPIRYVRERIKYRARLHGQYANIDENGDELLGVSFAHHEEREMELRGHWANVAELSTCPWCVSIWISAGVVFGSLPWVDLEYPVLWWGAVAGLAAIIAHAVDWTMKD